MIDNDSLTRALTALELYAPAEAGVLAGFRDGVRRRRRRRQVVSGRGCRGRVAGGTRRGSGRARPRGRSGRHATGHRPAAVGVHHDPADPPAPPALPFTAGSLPAGYTLDTWYIGPGWSSASWIGKADFEQVVVDLRDVPQQGGEYLVDEPTTIGGRPGRFRKLAPDKGLVEFIWQFEDGRWFVVSGSQREVGLPALRAVADGLTPQPAPVPAPSGLMLGQLPDGYRMEIQSGVGPVFVSMMLCRTRPDLSAGTPADCIGITLSEGVAPAYQESRGRDGATTRIPVDQESVVGGVSSRASADGTLVYRQLDPGHWAVVDSRGAGVGLLRQVASAVVLR
jgi:hypothetical protein